MAKVQNRKSKRGSQRLTRCDGCGEQIDMDGGDWAVFLKDNKNYTAHWGGQYGCECVHVIYHPEEGL